MERLQEGAAKRVPPDRLISVLRRDYERLKSVVNVLEDTGYGHAKGSSSYKKNLKLLSIIIRGGVSEEVVTELFEQSHTLGEPLTVATSACDAVFQVEKITTLSDKNLVRFGKTLLRSELPPSSYSSTASLFLKGKVSRLNDFEILNIIVRVLENDGGLIQIERELQRRTRNR